MVVLILRCLYVLHDCTKNIKSFRFWLVFVFVSHHQLVDPFTASRSKNIKIYTCGHKNVIRLYVCMYVCGVCFSVLISSFLVFFKMKSPSCAILQTGMVPIPEKNKYLNIYDIIYQYFVFSFHLMFLAYIPYSSSFPLFIALIWVRLYLVYFKYFIDYGYHRFTFASCLLFKFLFLGFSFF